MSDENKTLTPVWVAYVDGKRLNTDYEGALKSIKITDCINGIGTAQMLFDISAINFDEDKVFSLMSEVSIHLGYKDDVEEVFKGVVIHFAPRFEPYENPKMEVQISSQLFQLKNGEHSRTYLDKSPSDIIKEILSLYNLDCDVEDFGPTFPEIEQFNITDYDYLKRLTETYGKSFYCYNNKVTVKSEITPSNDDVILEWGKSLISADTKNCLKKQLSEVTCFGHDMQSDKDFSATAKMSDLSLKIGGSYNWEDNSKGADSNKVHYINGGVDEADAKEIAAAFLLRRSFEFQTAHARTEGNYKIKPGNRLTLKYLGEGFSGEYMISFVTHSFDMLNGYETECDLMRNCCETSSSKGNVSEIDAEMSSTLCKQSNNPTSENEITDPSNQNEDEDIVSETEDEDIVSETEDEDIVSETEDDNPKIIKVELLDDNNMAISGSEIRNYVNLPDKNIFIDNDTIKGHYQLNSRMKCKITFNKKGVFDFKVSLKNIELKADYSTSELTRNSKYKFSKENEPKQYNTDSDGTKIISEKDFYFGQGGGNLFKFKAWTTDENDCVLSTTSIRTWRRLYYVEVKMTRLTTMANSLSTAINEYQKHYIELKKIGTESVSFRQNIDTTDSNGFTNDVRSRCNKAQYTKYNPYIVNITYTGHLAVKEAKLFKSIISLNTTPFIEYEFRNIHSNSRNYLWMNIDTQEWFNSCTVKINGISYQIPENKVTPLASTPNRYSKVRIDVSYLSLRLPATVELTLNVNIVNRMRAGISFGGNHTVALCTRAYWKDKTEIQQNQVLIHELGHQVGMVPNGTNKSKLTKGTYHYSHTHVGDHCYNGYSSSTKLDTNSSICVMYGATNGKSTFCSDCGKKVKQTDLSGGLY